MTDDLTTQRDNMLSRMAQALPSAPRIMPGETRAKMVRDAFRAIACEPDNVRDLPLVDRNLAWQMCQVASDETLALLGRMLR